jgi:hypothetical protein
VMIKNWKKNSHAAELDEHVVMLKHFLAGGLGTRVVSAVYRSAQRCRAGE